MHCGTAVAFAERKIIIVDDVSLDEKRMREKYRRRECLRNMKYLHTD